MMAALLFTVTLLLCVLGGQALDLLRAKSGVPPPVPRVHCWCSSYPNVTLCSWPEPSHCPPTHYVATYSERHGQPITEQCHLIPPSHNSSSPTSSSSSSSSSEQWHCQLPNLKLLTDYIINVTAVNSGGSSSYLSSFMLEDIVKPDPPVDVRVSSHSTRNLLVQWSPPSTWTNLHIFPLKYQIMYQWENRGIASSVNLGPFESAQVELKGLSPGREYLFQVCAKELLDLGKCSNWSSPVNITLPRMKP
ncbi:interleukin-27 subunit beta [Hippoglossus stenolepis]|uniref:interleukin-27 subunit beta n=1 Tax=Hippoglossus stenolepis TaxID=195615 RepID=UPI001FAEA99A|nr:interleukin-27 subunit beta [Hippoglossus stenolepis]